jgi:hypothetical protein
VIHADFLPQAIVTDSTIVAGAGLKLLDAIVDNWPIVAALVAGILYLGRFAKGFESLTDTVKEGFARFEARLNSHSGTLDEFSERLTRTEALVELHLEKSIRRAASPPTPPYSAPYTPD